MPEKASERCGATGYRWIALHLVDELAKLGVEQRCPNRPPALHTWRLHEAIHLSDVAVSDLGIEPAELMLIERLFHNAKPPQDLMCELGCLVFLQAIGFELPFCEHPVRLVR